MISLIIVQNLLFQIIEWSEFHTFCQALNSNLNNVITMTHSQIEWKIKNAFQTYKNIIWKKFQLAFFSIHFFVDIWISLNNHLLLAITVDFVDCTEEKHMKTLLAFQIVKDYNEEKQFTVLLSVFQDYDIVQKLEAVVADNSDTNDILCQEIEAHLLNKENLVWESSHWWFCCLNHIINLAVQVFLFHNVVEMKKMKLYNESEICKKFENMIKWKFWFFEFLDKLYNIIVNTCSSADCTAEFWKLASRMISLDNHTWWNSWYLLLVVTDKHESSIDTYIKNHFENLFENYLILQD